METNRVDFGEVPFLTPFLEASPTKIDYRKKGTPILTSLLENLVGLSFQVTRVVWLEIRTIAHLRSRLNIHVTRGIAYLHI